MKKIDVLKRKLVFGVSALAVILLAMPAGAENVPQVVQVIKVKGIARYSTDRHNWHTLKDGDIFPPGVVIQTASHSSVDIQMMDQKNAGNLQSGGTAGDASPYVPPTSGLNFSPEVAKANVVRIFESSVLAVDKLTVERTSVDEVADTQLDLEAGRIIGNVKKLSGASKYEIKIPNGVAGIRGSAYSLTVLGLLKMFSGSAILAQVGADGTVKTWLINALYGFNPQDGTIFPLPADESSPPGDLQPLWRGKGPPFTTPPYCPPPFTPVR